MIAVFGGKNALWCAKRLDERKNVANQTLQVHNLLMNAVSANCNFRMDEKTWIKLIIGHKFKRYQDLEIIFNYSSHIMHDLILNSSHGRSEQNEITKQLFAIVEGNWFSASRENAIPSRALRVRRYISRNEVIVWRFASHARRTRLNKLSPKLFVWV